MFSFSMRIYFFCHKEEIQYKDTELLRTEKYSWEIL